MGDASVIKVDDKNLDDVLMEQTAPILLVFGARWCRNCKAIAPALEELHSSKKMAVLHADVDYAPLLAQKYSIKALPGLLILNELGSVEKFVPPVMNKSELLSHLAPYLI